MISVGSRGECLSWADEVTTGGLHEGEWGDRAAHGGIDGVACAERSLGIGRVAVATRLTRQHGGKLGLAREAAMRATLTALSFGTARLGPFGS